MIDGDSKRCRLKFVFFGVCVSNLNSQAYTELRRQ